LTFTFPTGIEDLNGEIEYLLRVLSLINSPPANSDLS